MMHGEPLNTIRERDAAKYLALSIPWLRQARCSGRGPAFVRIGRAIRYRVQDLEAFLESHRVQPRGDADADAYAPSDPLELVKR